MDIIQLYILKWQFDLVTLEYFETVLSYKALVGTRTMF